ncbi:MAG: helix-turn-helix domain-containing protein [Hyphomicrobiales bacterium]|nr:helix-turn-helix domain-containing protein [Hyphomicrobiales bacterium]
MSGPKGSIRAAPPEIICTFCGVHSSGICSALAPEEIVELDRMAKRALYAPKDTIFSQGERLTRIYIVTEGLVRLSKLLPDGRRQVIGFRLPGDVIGLSNAEHYGVSADAINQVAVCWLPKPAFMRFAGERLALLRKLNEFALRELSAAYDRMLLLGRFSVEEKLASFLIGWRDRLARLSRAQDIVPLPMSRRDIADYLGLTIETVSRTFTKFEREKLIVVHGGGVSIVDDRRLTKLAVALSS